MKTLGMKNLEKFLTKIVKHKLQNSLMIWGAPGIGKSSVVQSIASKNRLELIDLRISQLAPTDLRGLPVPLEESASWLPPDFLPTSGKGKLFFRKGKIGGWKNEVSSSLINKIEKLFKNEMEELGYL